MLKYLLNTLLLSVTACSALAQTTGETLDGGVAELPTGIHMNDDTKLHVPKKYSVLAVAPMQVTEAGLGTSVSYERAIDKDGIVSYIIPAIVAFSDNSISGGEYKYTPMFYVDPGIKFYPTSCYGKIKYALGPSLVVGYGRQMNTASLVYDDRIYDKFILGVMITNSVNFNLTRHLYMALGFGMGFTYINQYNGVGKGANGTTEAALKMGYRF